MRSVRGSARTRMTVSDRGLEPMREVIRKQPRTRKEHFEVAICDLAASAIEVLVNVYFEVPDRHQELAARDEFDYEVVNDELDRAADELERLVRAELVE